jgi:glycosyltransferase involved in cell wall biosynthesis
VLQRRKASGSASNWRRKRAIYERSVLHVATAAQWLQDHLDDSILAGGIRERRLIVTGVDLERFAPGSKAEARQALGLPDDGRPVLLFAANSTGSNEFKDFATLERALGLLTSEVIAVSVGEAGETRRIGTAERRMVGHTDRIEEWYRAADVYVHPARADTFPGTELEALASGLPVVGSAVNGIPEQVTEGETRHLVTPGDAGAMARRRRARRGPAAPCRDVSRGACRRRRALRPRARGGRLRALVREPLLQHAGQFAHPLGVGVVGQRAALPGSREGDARGVVVEQALDLRD